MAIEYAKDVNGRIAVNVGHTVIPKKNTDLDFAAERNAAGQVFFKDGDIVDVVVKINGVEYATIASFTGKAARDTMSSVYVRVRAFSDAKEPPAPIVDLDMGPKP